MRAAILGRRTPRRRARTQDRARGSRRAYHADMAEPSAPSADPGARVALITAPDREAALRLARGLVEARVAACVNVVPGLTSVYRWQGAIQEDAEVLLVVKTRVDRVAELERLVARLHPYEVPELVLLAPSRVERRYLDWLLEQSAPDTRADGA